MQAWLKESGPVQLKQFGHQVGGHSLIMGLTEDTICKQLIPREHFFYTTLSQDMQLFFPEYHGKDVAS